MVRLPLDVLVGADDDGESDVQEEDGDDDEEGPVKEGRRDYARGVDEVVVAAGLDVEHEAADRHKRPGDGLVVFDDVAEEDHPEDRVARGDDDHQAEENRQLPQRIDDGLDEDPDARKGHQVLEEDRHGQKGHDGRGEVIVVFSLHEGRQIQKGRGLLDGLAESRAVVLREGVLLVGAKVVGQGANVEARAHEGGDDTREVDAVETRGSEVFADASFGVVRGVDHRDALGDEGQDEDELQNDA
mmetsp:Transcript_14906/g.48656  ORF Transcript_14906/g.48656 Transcript_14906/m.48656 type:complete len:243 (+) Transcript_14906:6467-7195(+)